ncbi:MAG: 6-phosphofructokinase [Rubricoccaceae bacterium]|nr:6-phosphofructokinase [Rubricoccaceae bacterium]
MSAIKTIGVFTSGGDAPGMNACIRAVTRRALIGGFEVVGIRRGFVGMLESRFEKLDKNSVSNILQKGGTMLKSARSPEFRQKEGRAKAAHNLREAGIDALVAIGGDGTLLGASLLAQEHGFAVVGCPGTIDNDLFGTDETIGFDSAINTALESIDKIRDTADAHERLFLIEVMGRDTGFIALACGIGAGAELILIPEQLDNPQAIKRRLKELMPEQSRSSIVVVAEGDRFNGAGKIAEELRNDSDFDDIDLRVTVLGHVQRGGAPTARDRILATRLGVAAVEALLDNATNVMVGLVNNQIVRTPLDQVCSERKEVDKSLLRLAEMVS